MTPGQRLARLRRARDDGFTLVESVVATTLFGIFAATLLTFVMGTFRMSVETQRRVAATHLASSVVAEARELAAQPLAAAAGGPVTPTIDPTFLDDADTVEVGGVPFQVTRTARVVTAEGADVCSAGLSAAVASAALVEVAVEVSWETGSSPVRLTERAALAERSFVAVRVHDETAPVPGLRVELLTSQQRTGGTPAVSSTTTGADGCAVFDVDPTADPAPHHWYAVQTGDAAQASAQYVTADGRFSTGARYLGRAEAGTVRSAVVEVRREATVRFSVVDETGGALVGTDLDDIAVTLVPSDGAAREQVRSTAEIGAPVVADDRTLTSWQYPVRHRDVALDALWWAGPGGAPVLTPDGVVITLHPTDRQMAPGETATFEVGAIGEGPLHVQWQLSGDGGYTWLDVADGEGMVELQLERGMVVGGALPVVDGLVVRAVVSNDVGHAVSGSALLRVLTEDGELPAPLGEPPTITVPPTDQSASVGDRLTFEVAATGDEPMFVLWQRSEDGGLTWEDLDFGEGLWSWQTPVLTAQDHGAWYRAFVIGAGYAASPPAEVSLFDDTREFTLRALWPTDYTLWLGSRPGALAPVALPPAGAVDVVLSVTGDVLAVRDADGVVTTAGGGAE